MQTDNQNLYLELMREIRSRTEYINALRGNPSLAIYNWIFIESICLQLRMILEDIALACLVANGDRLEDLPKRIEKEYHADTILKRLDGISPECYPEPLILTPASKDTIKHVEITAGSDSLENFLGTLVERPTGDWLTREDFGEVYGRIGQILHARNPLGVHVDFDYYNAASHEWQARIMNLLSHHKISVIEEKRMYIVQMNAVAPEDTGSKSGDVHITTFEALEPQP